MDIRLRRPAGVTLVEAMLVMALVAASLVMVVPAWSQAVHGMRVSSYANGLLAHLMLARSEAIKRSGRAALCPSGGADHCEPDRDWSGGWLVFVDANNNGSREPDEPLLARQDAVAPDYQVVVNQNLRRYLSFDAQGRTRLTSGAFQAGTFTFCREGSSASMSEARQLVVSAAGRPRMARLDHASCRPAANATS